MTFSSSHLRNLLSGRRRGSLAVTARAVLAVGEVPYRIAVACRNRRFDSPGAAARCGIPVISIGNLTVGGTGKTPMVRYVARLLRQHDLRVAIVSRGYGAAQGAENDEAMELSRSLPDVPHLQHPDRVASAGIAVEELESQVILMDDGFQHRRLHRDLDIVLIDATCPFGFDHLLPRGLLREPVSSLKRAHVAVLTRSDQVDAEQREAIRRRVESVAPHLLFVEAVHRPAGLLTWPERIEPVASLAGKRAALVSAVGNPQAFRRTVEACGAEVIDAMSLPDHDRFEAVTVERIRGRIEGLAERVDVVLCTHKDLVKLQTDRLGGKPMAAVTVEMDFPVGREQLDAAVIAATQNWASAS